MVVVDGGIDVEAALVQYQPLIHKLARQCARKLPPYTGMVHEDLVSEGQIRLVRAAQGYRPPARLDGDRAGWAPGRKLEGSSFFHYLHVALVNGYAKIVTREWTAKRRPTLLKGQSTLDRIAVLPEQEAVETAIDMERGYLLDRYSRYQKALPRLTVSRPPQYPPK